ncbi:hypothetical protein GYMLUDRAFT_248655 [Collybiopsis luxurians FD-317 M1]|uniref:Unplaced genomic scaffold GYMLUscaffold_58, whole genome shotgun sequence n=1 Tax=Collybiopsis luxurians FD-317 M1 TaxID=944289 RepID=A0A0D0CK37_9AGAR|nr:hypothetical protein GYMLUDRAFT_248655 [Collybiopsis luxurians FD-317 M1]
MFHSPPSTAAQYHYRPCPTHPYSFIPSRSPINKSSTPSCKHPKNFSHALLDPIHIPAGMQPEFSTGCLVEEEPQGEDTGEVGERGWGGGKVLGLGWNWVRMQVKAQNKRELCGTIWVVI